MFQLWVRKMRNQKGQPVILFRQVSLNRLQVSLTKFQSFYGSCVVACLFIPWVRFYALSLHTGMENHTTPRRWVMFSHQEIHDLWSSINWRRRPSLPFYQLAKTRVISWYLYLLHHLRKIAQFAKLPTENLSYFLQSWNFEMSIKGQFHYISRTQRIFNVFHKKTRDNVDKSIQNYCTAACVQFHSRSYCHTFVSASSELIRELQRLKILLDKLGLTVRIM